MKQVNHSLTQVNSDQISSIQNNSYKTTNEADTNNQTTLLTSNLAISTMKKTNDMTNEHFKYHETNSIQSNSKDNERSSDISSIYNNMGVYPRSRQVSVFHQRQGSHVYPITTSTFRNNTNIKLENQKQSQKEEGKLSTGGGKPPNQEELTKRFSKLQIKNIHLHRKMMDWNTKLLIIQELEDMNIKISGLKEKWTKEEQFDQFQVQCQQEQQQLLSSQQKYGFGIEGGNQLTMMSRLDGGSFETNSHQDFRFSHLSEQYASLYTVDEDGCSKEGQEECSQDELENQDYQQDEEKVVGGDDDKDDIHTIYQKEEEESDYFSNFNNGNNNMTNNSRNEDSLFLDLLKGPLGRQLTKQRFDKKSLQHLLVMNSSDDVSAASTVEKESLCLFDDDDNDGARLLHQKKSMTSSFKWMKRMKSMDKLKRTFKSS